MNAASFLTLALVFLAGLGQPIQTAVNTRLREHVAAPGLSALVSFVGGTLALLLLTLSGALGRPRWQGLTQAPWWALTGGLFGAVAVVSAVVALPRWSSLAIVAALVAGQLVAAVVIDQFGLLHVPRTPLSATRLVGVLFLLLGVLLVTRRP